MPTLGLNDKQFAIEVQKKYALTFLTKMRARSSSIRVSRSSRSTVHLQVLLLFGCAVYSSLGSIVANAPVAIDILF